MADYTNNLGVKALTLADINKQYGINASKDYAKAEANRILDSNLKAIEAQKTQAQEGAYQQSRKKDLSYFDQFQDARYNTAGRGLTGGMQNMAQRSLEMARNQDLADIYSNLNTQMASYGADERRYRNEATSYADQLYNTNLAKAQDLIGADFSRRLAIAQEEHERRLEAAAIKRQLEQQAFDNKITQAYLDIARRNSLGSGSGSGSGGRSGSGSRSSKTTTTYKTPSKTTGDANRDALIKYIAQKAEERRTTNLRKSTAPKVNTGSKYATTAYNPSKSYIANKYNVPDKVIYNPYAKKSNTRVPIRNLAR